MSGRVSERNSQDWEIPSGHRHPGFVDRNSRKRVSFRPAECCLTSPDTSAGTATHKLDRERPRETWCDARTGDAAPRPIRGIGGCGREHRLPPARMPDGSRSTLCSTAGARAMPRPAAPLRQGPRTIRHRSFRTPLRAPPIGAGRPQRGRSRRPGIFWPRADRSSRSSSGCRCWRSPSCWPRRCSSRGRPSPGRTAPGARSGSFGTASPRGLGQRRGAPRPRPAIARAAIAGFAGGRGRCAPVEEIDGEGAMQARPFDIHLHEQDLGNGVERAGRVHLVDVAQDRVALEQEILEFLAVENPQLAADFLDPLGVAPVGRLGDLVDLQEIAGRAGYELEDGGEAVVCGDEEFRAGRPTTTTRAPSTPPISGS